MHDANQDELMLNRMAYFRCKWTHLPTAYQDFLTHRLLPGAPIMFVRGTLTWPVIRVGPRHRFQNGAYGGMDPDDYQTQPHAPRPDEVAAEAEWGTTPHFEHAVQSWAKKHGHPFVSIAGTDPQALAARAATA